MSDELPEELKEPLIGLWRMDDPMVVTMLPRAAFTAVAVIQYACRNPQLSAIQRVSAEMIARAIQAELAAIDPVVGKYLELGWDPSLDVPQERKYTIGRDANDRAWIQCHQCGAVSYNRYDIAEKYCGRCHRSHVDSDPPF